MRPGYRTRYARSPFDRRRRPTTIATTTCAARNFRQRRATPIKLMNMLNAVTRGVEITSKAQLVAVVAGRQRLHATCWKEFTFDPGSTRSHARRLGGQRSASPLQSAFVYQRRRRFEIDAFCRYVSALPQPAVDAYAELDARIGYRVQPGMGSGGDRHEPAVDEDHLEFRAGTPPQLFERAVTLRSTWRF